MNSKIHSYRTSFFRTVALVVMSVITFAGIADGQLTVNKVRLWTENSNVVPVCWETDGYDREKQIVMAAVSNTWQEFANVNFTGWGKCPGAGTERHVRIRISAQGKDNAGASGSARYGMGALSSANDKNPGVNMSFNPDGTADKGRVEYIAVHEFGHVLGFIHEQDSPNHNAAH